MMRKKKFRILPCGDAAVTVEFGNEISPGVNAQAAAMYRALLRQGTKGITEMIPTFRSLTICYDPCVLSYALLLKSIKKAAFGLRGSSGAKKRIVKIPVCYGGEYGVDLEEIAKMKSMTPEAVVSLHASRDYLIYMMGFLPGFAYLGGLDERLFCPRLESPRTAIPAGSVGIGGEQTGIYPLASPGGWRLIGMTPVIPYDSNRKVPFLYQAGDYIRFVPVSKEEYDRIRLLAESDEYVCDVLEE